MSAHPLKIDHIGLPVTDLERSRQFYAAALAPLGFVPLGSSARHAAFGIGHMPYLTIHCVERLAGTTHLALIAAERSQVDAFHVAATAAGGVDHGAPGLRPGYHEHYYAAFVLDPDGHNIELVKHLPE